ncbi:sugar transporter [Roseovarius salinarum]|uniref:sugar transporter n=1 Tax=Roseovarius salinarum TaxID=1981892 RepID=UPI0012FFE8AA|nr:sugar transporter [Roseovarius salinarum]
MSNDRLKVAPDPSTEDAASQTQSEEAETQAEQKQPSRGGAKRKAGKGGQKAADKPAPRVVEIAPPAEPAKMKQRHWGLVASFGLMVLVPLIAVASYLWMVADDQYASKVGFTVRQENSTSASDLIGGLAQFAGASGSGSDTDILYEFIQSPALVERLEEDLSISEHYQSHYDSDPIFGLSPEASMSDLVDFWSSIIRISYDQSTGLIELRVLAFEPDMAQTIAQSVVSESQDLINDLNANAREDMIQYAKADLEEAQARLKAAREALTRYRTETQIVDPETDIQGRMGVLNTLQQQLAEALIQLDLIRESNNGDDPRIQQAKRRIEVIRERIAEERANVTSETPTEGGPGYPKLISEYEGLVVEREFAEKSYGAALTALEQARSKAMRQTRYLAAYVKPTYPHSSEFPQRWMLFGLSALFLLLAWAIATLIFYSVRDSR